MGTKHKDREEWLEEAILHLCEAVDLLTRRSTLSVGEMQQITARIRTAKTIVEEGYGYA